MGFCAVKFNSLFLIVSFSSLSRRAEMKNQLTAMKSRGDYSLKKLKSDSIHSIESEIDTSEMRL